MRIIEQEKDRIRWERQQYWKWMRKGGFFRPSVPAVEGFPSPLV